MELQAQPSLHQLETCVKIKDMQINHYIFKDLYYNADSSELELSQRDLISGKLNARSKELSFCFEEIRDQMFVKKLCSISHFDVDSLTLSNIQKRNKYYDIFLDFSFPNKVNWFCIEAGYTKKQNIAYYFDRIIKISHKICINMVLCGFIIKGDQLKRLLSSFKHCKLFELFSCKLSIPNSFNLSQAMKNTKLETLMFYHCDFRLENCISEDRKELNSLIEGLGTSESLISSLKELDIRDCKICKKTILELLEQNGFGDVKILV
ncbi:unnamed protein product [Moneuplotes crassus]|uniref:Uncharacterized protein n=1 Tax=Euplotes crassus TaxID=5936 RepID=A0AAD2D5I1_EUPCR|nr:unnamed protein product [Moneuplotes crassus]